MRPFPLIFLICGGFLSACGASSEAESATGPGVAAAPAPAADPDGWPRVLKEAGGSAFTIYQPQLDSWDGATVVSRVAVAVQEVGAKAPVYGVVTFRSDTQTDRAGRTVTFENLRITGASFPSDPAKQAEWSSRLSELLPSGVKTISLDRLEASYAVIAAEKASHAAPLRNEPPEIIFSKEPAMLLLTDGAPLWRKAPGTTLERAVNTRALLVRDSGTGMLYLHLWDGYVTASRLEGPWVRAGSRPDGLAQVETAAVAAKTVDLLAGIPEPKTEKKPSLASNKIPKILFSATPAELIVTEGEPDWKPVQGTSLLYVANTPANLFKRMADQTDYILVSGRWFKASDPKGPWTYVSPSKLPVDFAAIPDDSPKENVKASVPGTVQAQEARIANDIPQTVRIERTAAMTPAPVYDGEPRTAPVAGTALAYVVNSATPVIKVSDTGWLACQNGVWFSAASPHGPWTVATSVPPAVYSIPPSSPLHYVTYVRVFRSDDKYVWVGYTPGYYGAYAGEDGLVVYGTGYLYEPYVGDTVYVSYPVTYGYGCGPCWTPWCGWYYGFAAGWIWADGWTYWGFCPPAPYWGPYWGYCYGWGYNAYGGVTAWGPYGWAGTSGDIYRTRGAWNGVGRAEGGYNAYTGNRWATEYGHAYNSTTGAQAAGQRGAIQNVYTGNYAYGARGVAGGADRVAFGGGGTAGNSNTGREVSGGHMTVVNRETGQVTHIAGGKGGEGNSVLDVNGNVYAGHDGHVYRKNDDGSWSQLSKPGGGATKQEPAQNFDRSGMERESRSREIGASRSGGFNHSFGGGGLRGGGGRRR